MLLITGITAQDRRDSVRELADISTKSYNDSQLDRKIENADEIAKTLLQRSTADADLINVSNIQTALLIKAGIADSENNESVRELRETSKRLVQSANGSAPEQTAEYTGSTNGILTKNEGDDF